VQRTYVLNDEAALVICDYGAGKRPETPFPYFAEAWTGEEYQAAATLIYAGMVREGVEAFENVRRRYDGERRNPWDEPECGHHYARAMSAWSGVLALGGFRYHGAEKMVSVMPRVNLAKFVCFWSAAPGWGMFSQVTDGARRRVTLSVTEGSLPLRSISLAPGPPPSPSAKLNGRTLRLSRAALRSGEGVVFTFAQELTLHPGEEVVLLA
jgi:hypothetical protein